MDAQAIKKIWNKKVQISSFWTGLGMQLFQASLITFWMFTTLDWSWFKIEYIITVVGAAVLLGYNIVSWRLLLKGLRQED